MQPHSLSSARSKSTKKPSGSRGTGLELDASASSVGLDSARLQGLAHSRVGQHVSQEPDSNLSEAIRTEVRGCVDKVHAAQHACFAQSRCALTTESFHQILAVIPIRDIPFNFKYQLQYRSATRNAMLPSTRVIAKSTDPVHRRCAPDCIGLWLGIA